MSDDLLKEAREAWAECEAVERDNRIAAKEDIRFARLGEQWDVGLKARRLREGRPCLTINKLPPFIRQVVNDARQNKPAIKVQPQDSQADPQTAGIMSGLIRNIEASSDADVAYDTALECAATSGIGYFRINLAYTCDDSWDQDIVFERVANPFSVYGDPHSERADSSDWNVAFVTEMMTKEAFEAKYPDADEIDFGSADFPHQWRDGKRIMVAEYWKRTQVKKKLYLLSDGSVLLGEDLKKREEELALSGTVVVGRPRDVLSYKVEQHILNGVEVLESVEWAGKYIPIIPVYGEEVNLDGKRYFRSLVRDAKDAQVMYNAWRTASTEMVAMAPKAPFIGRKGAFNHDLEKWESANKASHAFIEYDGAEAPQRQPFPGVPAGALQEALNASDDMKAIIGIYDAGLGARSNETSGVAINSRKRESDVSTFHYIDNLSRSIRHAGRVLLDLIPKVYGEDRIVRVLGEQQEVTTAKLGSPEQARQTQGIEGVERIYALGLGKYDLTVRAGPSFTTRREEAAAQMMELLRSFPAAAPVIGDLIAKNLDWPGADEIAERLKAMQGQGGLPPEIQQQMQAGMQEIQRLTQENEQLKADRALEAEKLGVDAFEAETDRLKVVGEMTRPQQVRPAF